MVSEHATDTTPLKFSHVSECHDGAGHSVGISLDGKTVYSWYERTSKNNGENTTTKGLRKHPPKNSFGQMGLGNSTSSFKSSSSYYVPSPIVVPNDVDDLTFVRAYTGGTDESGHSALLDSTRRRLYVCGCDRWQQLGLGSGLGGSVGYTWKGGRLWQDVFGRNEYLEETKLGKNRIRDVALGGDHTVVLSDNGRDVIVFGRGGDGQLGMVGKPYVSAPVKSKELSLSSAKQKKNATAAAGPTIMIAAVCAVRDCSATLQGNGDVMTAVGRCNSKLVQDGLLACRERARRDGLID